MVKISSSGALRDSSHSTNDAKQQRLSCLLDQYLLSLESNKPQSADEVCQQNPEIAELFRSHLSTMEKLHGFAAGVRGAAALNAAANRDSNNDSGTDETKRTFSDFQLGDFKIIRELGRGGMGIVYEARQQSIGRRVAIKVLPAASALNSRQIARFTNEAQAAARLQHPGIVSIYSVGSDRGIHYYAMQLIDGTPLDQWIEAERSTNDSTDLSSLSTLPRSGRVGRSSGRGGSDHADTLSSLRLDSPASGRVSSRNQAKSNAEENCAGGWKQCVTWAIEAADALHCAHENGIVHRDIKPSNLIVDHAEKVWITDFGLARCQTNESQSNAPQNKKAQRDATLTRTGDLLGTIRYMSPEQASGHTELVDHRTDIYALAATVFELLTLQPAVEGESGPLLLQKITSQSPRTLRSVRSDLPRDLGVVLQKAMASSKDDRYFNAKQFADDLQAVIDDRPIVARPPSLSQRAFRYTRRHKRVFAASVAVATVAFLGAAISLITFAHKSQLALTSEIQAQRYFNQARATVDHLGADVATQLAAIPGAEHVRQDLLRDTLAYYEEFVLQASDDPKSLSDVARTHHRIGVLTSELHSPSQALRSFQQSANTYDQIATDSDADPVLQTQATENLNAWGLALIQSGKLAEAKTVLANAASRQQKLVDREPDSVSLAVQLALIENNAGLLALHQGAAEIAQQHFAVSINILRVQQKRAQTETQALPERAHRALAAALQNSSKGITKSDPAGAIILLEEAISMQLDLANRSSNRLRATQDMAVMYNNLASAHSEINNDEMAAQALQRAIALQRQLRLVAPNVSQYSSELALSLNNLAMIRQRQSNHAEAAELISQAITLHKSAGSSVGPANGSSPQEQVRLGAMLHNQALSKIANGDLPGAIDVLHAAIRCQKRVLQTQPSQPKANAFLSQHYTQLLKCQTRLKRWQDVETTAKEYSNTAKDSPKQLSELRNDLAAAGKTMPPDIRRRLPSLVASTEVAK